MSDKPITEEENAFIDLQDTIHDDFETVYSKYVPENSLTLHNMIFAAFEHDLLILHEQYNTLDQIKDIDINTLSSFRTHFPNLVTAIMNHNYTEIHYKEIEEILIELFGEDLLDVAQLREKQKEDIASNLQTAIAMVNSTKHKAKDKLRTGLDGSQSSQPILAIPAITTIPANGGNKTNSKKTTEKKKHAKKSVATKKAKTKKDV